MPPVNVPTDVKLEPVTVDLIKLPVRVSALAVTVPDPPTVTDVPLIVI